MKRMCTPDLVFNTANLILEVQSRPALWDTNSKEYADRDMKKECWLEIVDIFNTKENPSDAERNECGRLLQRKWKGLRDCYTRECHRLAKLKNGSALRKTPYIYYKHLSFLGTVIKSKKASGVTEEFSAEEAVDNPEESVSAIAESKIYLGEKRKAEKTSRDVADIVTVLKERMKAKEDREVAQEDDSERMFLLSLVRPLKEIPEYMRFSVKIQIMHVIERARQRVTDSTTTSPSKQHQQGLAGIQQRPAQQKPNTSTPERAISPESTSNDSSVDLQSLDFTNI